MTYSEFLEQNAPCVKCFFAFSPQQFESGRIEAGISSDEKVLAAGAGLYGTSQGIADFLAFYDDRDLRIASSCSAQEVYNYEFSNHECSYTGDDEEALEIVKRIFGDGVSEIIQRGYAQ